jgi:hypothetical protein
MVASINIMQAVACDDVRQETSGKFILIGVYGGNIGLPAFPAHIGLAFWMRSFPEKIGNYHLQFRVRGPNDSVLASGQMIAAIRELEDTVLVIPALPVQIQNVGQIVLEYREGNRPWNLIWTGDVRLLPSPPPLG